VRFYDLRVMEHDELHGQEVKAGFWQKLGTRVDGRTPEERERSIRGKRVFGEHRVATRPAQQYFYVGRVRDRAEWPDTLLDDGSGTVGQLEPNQQDAVLLEPCYLVPFGRLNQVAIMSMSQSSPSIAALEDWLTAQVELDLKDCHLSLIPILNPTVMERLRRAQGATVLAVAVEPMREVPRGGGQIGRAIRASKEVSSETDLTLKWSMGNRKAAPSTKADLLEGARWVDGSWAKSAEVSLDVPDDDGRLRREHYNLIKERFTVRARWDSPDGEHHPEMSVVAGITDAIDEFNRRVR
jgi:hypothetical protein